MAVVNRSTKIGYVNEVNTSGVATQVELDDAIQNHINTYHKNGGIYFDTNRNAWLSNETFLINYSDPNKNARHRYFYNFNKVRANYIPFKLYDSTEYVIIGFEFHNSRVVDGKIIEIRDMSDSSSIYDINISNSSELEIHNLNIVLNDVKIAPFIKGISLKRPLLTLAIKKKVNI